MINRDKILRFGEKFEKKIFATTFFRTEICPCLSLLIFSRWLFFSQSAWHYMCHVTYDPVSTNEIADATRGAQTHCAVKPPYCFCVWEALPRGCRVLYILNWIMQLFANGYLSNFGVLMKNIWGMKCTCSFVSSKGGLFSDMVQSLIILPSGRAAILCSFTVYFGLFV